MLNSSSHCATGKPKPIPKVRTWIWRPFPAISDDIQRGFEEYGDLIQLQGFGVRVYCLRNPEHIECVFKDPKVGIAKIPSVFPRLRAMMPRSIVANPGDEVWSNRRKQIQTVFSNSPYMEEYARITANQIQEMLDERWSQFAESKQRFNLYDEIQRMLTCLGFQLFMSEKLSDAKFLEIHDKCHFIESQYSQRLAPILPTRNDRRVRSNTHYLRRVILEIISHRRTQPSNKNDLVSFLLTNKDAATGEPFTQDCMVDLIVEMFMSIRVISPPLGLSLRLIAENIEVQDRLIQEIMQVDYATELSIGKLPHLEYCQMVISEVFRLYPSTLAMPRWCEEGIRIDGYEIPPKSVVVSMIYHTHRNPKIFNEPERFLPDRWRSDRETEIPHYARLAFGAGKRACLGMHLARMIMKTAIVSIFKRYRIQSEFGRDWKPCEIELQIHPSRPINVRLIPVSDLNSLSEASSDETIVAQCAASVHPH